MFRKSYQRALFSALFVASLMLVPLTTLAQDPAPLELEPFQVYLQANETVSITVNGYCLNRGLPFPGEVMEFSSAAPDEVRAAIGYIVQEDLIEEDLYQTQLAIWNLTDGRRSGEEQELAEDIIAYATSGKPADDGVAIMSLPEAVEQGLVSVQVTDYVNIVPPPYFYYGEGELTITNLTNQPQLVHIPYGMTFADETQEGVQDMGMFASKDADPIDPPKGLPESGGSSPHNAWIAYSVIAVGAIFLLVGLRSQRLSSS